MRISQSDKEIFLMYLFIVLVMNGIFFACDKKASEDPTALHLQFARYLSGHMDCIETKFSYADVLEIAEKNSCRNTWRIGIDSVEIISQNGRPCFRSLNFSRIHSAITKTWTPSLPDTHSGMGNSVTDPESLYIFNCKNDLSVDSIFSYLALFKKQKQ